MYNYSRDQKFIYFYYPLNPKIDTAQARELRD